MKKWMIPLRSGLIIGLALVSEELIRFKDFKMLWIGMPYILGVALGFIAIEYIRLYKVQFPQKEANQKFNSLVWP